MAAIQLKTSLLLQFLFLLGQGEPAKNSVKDVGKSSEGYIDAYGPAYSNGLAEETGRDYSEGETEAVGDYMVAMESYEAADQDTPPAEELPKVAMAIDDYRRMISEKGAEMVKQLAMS